MKNFITINQRAFSKVAELKGIKVDLVDSAIFDWIKNFTLSGKAVKKLLDNKIFIWGSYQKIIDDNPLLGISSKDVIARRVNKLVNLGLIEKYISKEDGNKTFFCITDFAFECVIESNDIEDFNSNTFNSKVDTLTTDGSDTLTTDGSDNRKLNNRKLNNRKLDIEKKNTKKKKFENMLLEAFAKNRILSFKQKLNLTKADEVIKAYGIKSDELEEIAKEYAAYVSRNKNKASRLDRFICAYAEGRVDSIENASIFSDEKSIFDKMREKEIAYRKRLSGGYEEAELC